MESRKPRQIELLLPDIPVRTVTIIAALVESHRSPIFYQKSPDTDTDSAFGDDTVS